jgi:hypothetical protein
MIAESATEMEANAENRDPNRSDAQQLPLESSSTATMPVVSTTAPLVVERTPPANPSRGNMVR